MSEQLSNNIISNFQMFARLFSGTWNIEGTFGEMNIPAPLDNSANSIEFPIKYELVRKLENFQK